MRSWLAALAALAVLFPACSALATEPDAPVSAEGPALHRRLDRAAARATRQVESRIERRAEPSVMEQIAAWSPTPPMVVPVRVAPAPRASVSRSDDRCQFYADRVLTCLVLGRW